MSESHEQILIDHDWTVTFQTHPIPMRGRFLVFVALFLLALSADGQSPAADQVYLPSAIHIVAPWAKYQSDVWISNESDDPVSVSMAYTPANAPPVPVVKRDVLKLRPHEHREITDIIALIGASGFGPIVFNACLDGADCTGASTANYRNISVHSRIYLPGPTGGTVGQDLDGIPWHEYGDARHPLKLVGIRVSEQFRTNLGLVNASDRSSVTLTATLYDGASHGQRDQTTLTLAPSESRQQAVTAFFPLLGEWSRLNRGRPATNAYVIITSNGTDDAFFAYGSLIDATTNDATTLTAFNPAALTDDQIASLYGTPVPPVQAVTPASRLSAKVALALLPTTPENCMKRTLGPRSAYLVDALSAAIKICNEVTLAAGGVR